MIPDEAVEAAYSTLRAATVTGPLRVDRREIRQALEAAAPHMMAPITRLADEWHEQGEELMADSKTFQMDEHISVELLKEGASMVENARHIRNAIAGAK